ncbi:response regulator, partial [Bacteroidales bacterium OttesenSCG-928-L19]|nr:response regulator [Bacteroidales bacterium OttesenSCG-928-L19]
VIPRKEKGTTMEVHIPMKKAVVDAFPDTLQQKSVLAVNKKYKILVVDDDAVFLSIVREMLLTLEQEVDICNTLADFEQFLPNISQYDMIITDRYMGAFSGIDTLQKVRHLDQSIPVCLMSGHSGFDDQKALSEGFDVFLLKPFTIQHLADLLNGISSPQRKRELSQEQDDYMLFLEEIFKGDQEIIHHILNSLVQSLCNNIILLREAIIDDNFSVAQSVCHKTLGTFSQLNITSGAEILKKMDASRGEEYKNWKDDVRKLLELMEALAEEITNRYLECE